MESLSGSFTRNNVQPQKTAHFISNVSRALKISQRTSVDLSHDRDLRTSSMFLRFRLAYNYRRVRLDEVKY